MTKLSINYFIHDAEGRMMLQMRNGPKSNPKPMRWGIFGGLCEEGETFAQTLVREFEEELGIARPLEAFADLGMVEIPGWCINLYALKTPLEWGEFKVLEGAGAGFFTPDEVDMLDLWDNHKTLLATYRQVKGLV